MNDISIPYTSIIKNAFNDEREKTTFRISLPPSVRISARYSASNQAKHVNVAVAA